MTAPIGGTQKGQRCREGPNLYLSQSKEKRNIRTGDPPRTSKSLYGALIFEDRVHFMPFLILGLVTVGLVIAFLVAGTNYMENETFGEDAGALGWIAMGSLGVSAVTFLCATLQVLAFRDDELFQQREKETDATALGLKISGTDMAPDFPALWESTFRRLNSYHHEAQQQIRTSYFIAQVTALLGPVLPLSELQPHGRTQER